MRKLLRAPIGLAALLALFPLVAPAAQAPTGPTGLLPWSQQILSLIHI